MKNKTICVVGLGYIGLPTAALLATCGYKVVGVDLNRRIVETINNGLVHIVEPELDTYVSAAVSSGRLTAFVNPQDADIFIICVPTPFHAGDGIPQPNIDLVLAATKSISSYIKAGNTVILESTSPVGTTEKIADILANEGVDIQSIHIAYCPERVLPGKILTELVENDRVIGGLNPESAHQVASFYRTFVRGSVLETDSKTAEMCKLTENSFRDVNIAFANELSLICAKEGVDVWSLIRLANRHPRVNILQPGSGVGGHCIAVDPWFMVARDPENTRIIKAAREVNERKTNWVIDQILIAAADSFARTGRTAKIACLGLTFKPDIDDTRESPAVFIVKRLLSQGCKIVVVEPNIKESNEFEIVDLEESLASADVVAVLVKHSQFIKAVKKGRFNRAGVIDFVGLFE